MLWFQEPSQIGFAISFSFESSNMCINTLERLDPQFTNSPIQVLCETTSVRKMNISYNIELEKLSKPN